MIKPKDIIFQTACLVPTKTTFIKAIFLKGTLPILQAT